MSDSEASEDLGYLVEQPGTDDSDDLAESGSEEASQPNGLFDLEAADTDEGGSDDSEGGYLDWSYGVRPENNFFPQFMRLPVELRYRVWESFCPDFTTRHRVLSFHCVGSGTSAPYVEDGTFLAQQTVRVRAVMAVHHESRQFALRTFPDSLTLHNRGVVRFNSKTDVVHLSTSLDLDRNPVTGTGRSSFHGRSIPALAGFSEDVRHLAVPPTVLCGLDLGAKFSNFHNLETVYYEISPREHEPQHLRWCVSDRVRRYSYNAFEVLDAGFVSYDPYMLCWPDLDNHRDYAETKIPLDSLEKGFRTSGIHIRPVKYAGGIWPMVSFQLDCDIQRFKDLQEWDGKEWLYWRSSDEEPDEESDEDPDQYESEGIDDSEFIDHLWGGEFPHEVGSFIDSEESDVIHTGEDDSVQEEDGSEEGEGALADGDPTSPIELTGDGAGGVSRFSSLEQSSDTLQEANGPSLDESDEPQPRASRPKRPRARAVVSDSEDDSAGDLPRKRARIESRQNPIVVSSDDDVEDQRRRMRANRRKRAVISEDEEENHSGSSGSIDVHDAEAEWSGISDSDDEVDVGEKGVRPMSLVEKLQLHREENPPPATDDDTSEAGDTDGDDYDARNYVDFQDDEEGNEVSEDDEDDDRYGLMEDVDDDQESYYGF